MESNPSLSDLPDPADTLEDQVMDFVETTVGRWGFPATWRRLSPERAHAMAVAYLELKGWSTDWADRLCAEADRLAGDGYVWRR